MNVSGGCKLTFNCEGAGRLLLTRNHASSLMVRRRRRVLAGTTRMWVPLTKTTSATSSPSVNLGDFRSDGSVLRPLDVEEQHAQRGV